MNTKLISMVVLSLVAFSGVAFAEKGEHKAWKAEQKEKTKAHFSQQKQENREFRKDLKGKTGQERAEAIKAHHEQQFAENKDFREKMHAEKTAALKDKLAKNPNLTEAQRNELLSAMENQYKGKQDFRNQRHEENTAFLQKVGNDTSLTQDQRRQAIKEHFDKQRAENEARRDQVRAERKALKESLKNKATPAAATATN